jgi:hypothetical protein
MQWQSDFDRDLTCFGHIILYCSKLDCEPPGPLKTTSRATEANKLNSFSAAVSLDTFYNSMATSSTAPYIWFCSNKSLSGQEKILIGLKISPLRYPNPQSHSRSSVLEDPKRSNSYEILHSISCRLQISVKGGSYPAQNRCYNTSSISFALRCPISFYLNCPIAVAHSPLDVKETDVWCIEKKDEL